jgi:hypothetical protein
MRSDLVFGAAANVSNRYLLTMLASKAARELHKPGVRIEDTTNDVLVRFSRANPIGCEQNLRERLVTQLRSDETRAVMNSKSSLSLRRERF